MSSSAAGNGTAAVRRVTVRSPQGGQHVQPMQASGLGSLEDANDEELEKAHAMQAGSMSKMLLADRMQRKLERKAESAAQREAARKEAMEAAKAKADAARDAMEAEMRASSERAAEKMRAKAREMNMKIERTDVAAEEEEEVFDVGMRQNAMEFDAFDLE